MTQMWKIVSDSIENVVEKGENACYQRILFADALSQAFSDNKWVTYLDRVGCLASNT